MRWRQRWPTLAALLTLALLLAPAVALAHAELVRSEPLAGSLLAEPPTRVRLWFSEPIEPEFYALEVYAADGSRVDRGDAAVPADDITALEATLQALAPGSYLVSWRVLSIDGHIVQNTFSFTVGAQPEAAPVLELPQAGPPFGLGATTRWWSFLFSFALVGGLAFLPLVVWPAVRAAGIAEEQPARRAARGLLWIAWPAVVGLLLLSLATLLLQAAEVTGLRVGDVLTSRAITRLLTGTRYGTWWIIRLALLGGLLAVTVALTVEARPGQGRLARWIGLALGAGLLATYALTGHASGAPDPTWLAILADWLHLVAGAIWVGGLIQLVIGLLPALATLDPPERRQLLARSVQRFSILAGSSVAILIATGLYAGLVHVPSWQALLDTAYGAALSGKLLLFSPLLLLGAINLIVLHPRFVRAARSRLAAGHADAPAEERTGTRLLRFIVLGEICLALLVLGVTGLLTGLPPATTVPGGGAPYSAARQADGFAVKLSVTPNQAGENRLDISIADAAGRPVDDAQVKIRLAHQDMAMDERQVAAQPAGAGRYQASGNFINMAGRWAADVEIAHGSAPNARVSFPFSAGSPPGAAGAGRPAFSPARILRDAATPAAFLGVLALLLAGLVFLRRSGWRRARPRRQAAWIGAGLVLVGTVATGSALAGAYRAGRPNPHPASADSLARGRQIYAQSCVSCHGISGRGDGPAGVMLRPRPADFREHMAAGHTDAQLNDWIVNGVDGTGMPAFGQQLSQEDIWHVVNYIRSFAQPSR